MPSYDIILQRKISQGYSPEEAKEYIKTKILSSVSSHPEEAEKLSNILFPSGDVPEDIAPILNPQNVLRSSPPPESKTPAEGGLLGAGESPVLPKNIIENPPPEPITEIGMSKQQAEEAKADENLAIIREAGQMMESGPSTVPDWAGSSPDIYRYVLRKRAENLDDEKIRRRLQDHYIRYVYKSKDPELAKLAIYRRYGIDYNRLFTAAANKKQGLPTPFRPPVNIPEQVIKAPESPGLAELPEEPAKAAGISSPEFKDVLKEASLSAPADVTAIPERVVWEQVNKNAREDYADINENENIKDGRTDRKRWSAFTHDFLIWKTYNEMQIARGVASPSGRDEYDKWVASISPEDQKKLADINKYMLENPEHQFGYFRWGDMPDFIKNFRVPHTDFMPFRSKNPDEPALVPVEDALTLICLFTPQSVLFKLPGFVKVGEGIGRTAEALAPWVAKRQPLKWLVNGDVQKAKKFLALEAEWQARLFPITFYNIGESVADKRPVSDALEEAAVGHGTMAILPVLGSALTRTVGITAEKLVPQNVKEWFNDWFGRGGKAGDEVADAILRSRGVFESIIYGTFNQVRLFKKALKDLGDDYPRYVEDIMSVLRGEKPSSILPIEMADVVQGLRDMVDANSRAIINELKSISPAQWERGGQIELVLREKYQKILEWERAFGSESRAAELENSMEDEIIKELYEAGVGLYAKARAIENNLGEYIRRSFEAVENKPLFRVMGFKVGGYKPDKNKVAAAGEEIRRLWPELYGIRNEAGDYILSDQQVFSEFMRYLESYGELPGVSQQSKGRIKSEILSHRKDLPPFLREALKEVKDPILAIMNTLAYQARWLQSTALFRELAQKPGVVFNNEAEIAASRKIIGDFVRLPENSGLYGLLAGKYIHQDVADALNISGYLGGKFGVENAFTNLFNIAATTPYKYKSTIWSLSGQFRNIYSNMFMSMAAKISMLSPFNWPYYLFELKRRMNPMSPEMRPYTEMLLKGRIIESNFVRSDIYRSARARLFNPERYWEGVFTRSLKEGAGKAVSLLRLPEKTWAFSDEWPKAAHFWKYLDTKGTMGLRSRGGMADIKNISNEMISNASSDVYSFWPDYENIPKIIRATRDIQFFGPFITFQWNAYRTLKNAIIKGIKEAASGDPSRLILITAATNGPYIAINSYHQFAFSAEERNMISAIDNKLPFYMRHGAYFPERDAGGGIEALWNMQVSPLDPWNGLPASAFMNYNLSPMEIINRLQDGVMAPPLFAALLVNATGEGRGGIKLYPSFATDEEKAAKLLKWAVRYTYLPSQLPGGFTYDKFREQINALDPNSRTPAWAIAPYLGGIKLTRIHIGKQLEKSAFDMKKDIEELIKWNLAEVRRAIDYGGEDKDVAIEAANNYFDEYLNIIVDNAYDFQDALLLRKKVFKESGLEEFLRNE